MSGSKGLGQVRVRAASRQVEVLLGWAAGCRRARPGPGHRPAAHATRSAARLRRRTARAVAATRTSITDVYGVGPIVAGTVLGYVRDIRRFPTRDRFASYNGTAPIEVSSGDRKIYRLSRRGNRQLNHAIHMAAISQIRHRGSEGRAYYEKKIAEGMTGKTALRCPETEDQRRALRAHDRRRAASGRLGPGRAHGERLCIQRGRLTPRNASSSDKPLPGHRQL